MKSIYNRSDLLTQRINKYSDPGAYRSYLSDPDMPKDLVTWVSRLGLLNGVPFNYLVPDEGMLPPESIRFFYLDPNWIEALKDGACSIGRNLTAETTSPDLVRDSAVRPGIVRQVRHHTPEIRARIFGMTADEPADDTISGFLLRSSLVLQFPSMGVNVYPKGHYPGDKDPILLKILRLEQLGPDSDTLICLVSGDASRVDIHEAPQALHYGIDCYDDDCHVQGKPVLASKNLHTFGNKTKTDPVTGTKTNSVTMSDSAKAVDISSCFRPDSRVVEMSTLANLILQTNNQATPPPGTTKPTFIDSATMGFEMTEGVGMVSFIKSTS